MKISIKITALLVCLMLVLGASGCAKENDPAKIVVAKVNGENIYRSDFDVEYTGYINMMAQYGMAVDENDENAVTTAKNSVLDDMISKRVLQQKMKELGFDKLTPEKIDEVKKSVDEQFKSAEESIKKDVEEEAKTDTSITDIAAEAKKRLDEELQSYGWTRESYLQQQLESAKQEAFFESVTGKVSVTDEEIKTYYDENVKTQEEEIKADATKYESYPIELYKPEGIIRVQHILIKVADEKSETASGLYGEGKEEDAWAVLANEFERIKPKADEVLAKVKAGEDFAKLMETYGEDPGMKAEPEKTDGYIIVPGTTVYHKEFTEAALKLKNTGDTSDLVKTMNGYHIIKKIGEIAPGPIAMDQVKDEIKETLLKEKKDAEWDKQTKAWQEAAKPKVEYFKPNMFVEVKAPQTSAPAASTPAAS